MNERERALIDASDLCYQYAKSLAREKHDWRDVALECSAMIDDYREQALTIDEIGTGSCQELSSFLVAPEIDYTSGLPRK